MDGLKGRFLWNLSAFVRCQRFFHPSEEALHMGQSEITFELEEEKPIP
jgi:hypothetical protein